MAHAAQEADQRGRQEQLLKAGDEDDGSAEHPADQQPEQDHNLAPHAIRQAAAHKSTQQAAGGHDAQHQANLRQPHPEAGGDKQGKEGVDEIGAQLVDEYAGHQYPEGARVCGEGFLQRTFQ